MKVIFKAAGCAITRVGRGGLNLGMGGFGGDGGNMLGGIGTCPKLNDNKQINVKGIASFFIMMEIVNFSVDY